jgi:hypothetical protein
MTDMHVYLPEKYRFPISDAHLLAIRSLPCFSVLAHSCANHPFNCKCSVYRRLSTLLSALVAYQIWPCPPSVVLFDSSWMSLSNHSSPEKLFSHWLCASCQHSSKGFLLSTSSLDLPNSYELASSGTNTLQVYVIISFLGNHPVVQTCIS